MAKVRALCGGERVGAWQHYLEEQEQVLHYFFLLTFKNFFTSFLDNSHSGTMRISEVYQKHIIIHKNFTCKKEKN